MGLNESASVELFYTKTSIKNFNSETAVREHGFKLFSVNGSTGYILKL